MLDRWFAVLRFVVFIWLINWPFKFQMTSYVREILVFLSKNCSSESTVTWIWCWIHPNMWSDGCFSILLVHAQLACLKFEPKVFYLPHFSGSKCPSRNFVRNPGPDEICVMDLDSFGITSINPFNRPCILQKKCLLCKWLNYEGSSFLLINFVCSAQATYITAKQRARDFSHLPRYFRRLTTSWATMSRLRTFTLTFFV